MATIHLVRHGRATGGWDDDPDPGLDELGWTQAHAVATRIEAGDVDWPPAIVTSPMRRCRETATPLAARWGVAALVEPLVTELPSPPGVPIGERVAWLRVAIRLEWSSLGPRYTDYRDAVVAYVAALRADTVIVSHFIAINAVIGACTGDDRVLIRRLDNTSVTVVETNPGGPVPVHLVRTGAEADTQIR